MYSKKIPYIIWIMTTSPDAELNILLGTQVNGNMRPM